MADIIQLLPDAIANQIAAGEVIQRPASVVKELLENSIDSGASNIKLIVKDAGKALIQVIDDGCGMSETDARMCFARHATSKIRKAKDLFAIRTMGFRGEAMASIAAIAQLEMRTRRQVEELGTKVVIEGSEVKTQEPCQCASGTSISVKNLFYNVPARRNFLKTTTVEMRHILDEFQRVVLAHPDVFFSLHHNGSEIFHLTAGNIRQRIVGIFGTNSNKKLVPVSEETDVLKLSGFVGKPEYAKKTRGEQYFFVNNRFIKSGYLNHAIMTAYEELLSADTFPLYVIFLEIDPSRIDINVHPTKQEIKFDDERLVYNYLKVAVRHALGQYSITPTLDFEQEVSMTKSSIGKMSPNTEPRQTQTFKSGASAGAGNNAPTPSKLESSNLRNWKKLYDGLEEFDESKEKTTDASNAPRESMTIESKWTENTSIDDEAGSFSRERKQPYQIHGTYIVSQIKSGFLLIDQQASHERILYERYLSSLNKKEAATQKELFPKNISIASVDVPLLTDILPEIRLLGFDIQEFGKDTFVIHGVPAELSSGLDEQKLIESLLEQYKANLDLKVDIKENIALSMARGASIKRGQILTSSEMQGLIDQLFACEVPYKSPRGGHCFITYDMDDLQKQFKK